MSAPLVSIDSPSFKHQNLINSSLSTLQMSRLGFMNVAVSEYLHRLNKTFLANKMSNYFDLQLHPAYCKSYSTICPVTRYTTIDGSCNNRQNPDWGSALRPFKRALPADYCDDVSKPRCAADGSELPSAREITLKMHRGDYEGDSRFTMMLATWGQFIDHDLTSTVSGKSPMNRPMSCCHSKSKECYPVTITQEDPFFKDCNSTCMEFFRSAPAALCSLGKREQMNQVSSFLDGSAVFGNTNQLANELREFKGGKLKVLRENERELLPVSTASDGCNLIEEAKKGRYCFQAGDSRANENLYLTALHVVMVRQHNSLAKELALMNVEWDDETIYQEARKILVAQIQHITYSEFLEPIIGSGNHLGEYSYDETLNPTINNHFASASFRFAHTLLPDLLRLSPNDTKVVLLRELLFYPFPLYNANGLDMALFGAVKSQIGKSDRIFSREVVHHLFQKRDGNVRNKRCGLDLVSLNIQRGRDHGLPGYTKWRKYCNLPGISMESLETIMDSESAHILRTLYKSVNDIDLYSGALSEIPVNDSMLGPTFTCLISEQFHAIKQGDRFWYETSESPQAFTEDQLKEIKKTTLSRILCDNGDNVSKVPRFAMKSEDYSQWIDCSQIPKLSFSPWKQLFK